MFPSVSIRFSCLRLSSPHSPNMHNSCLSVSDFTARCHSLCLGMPACRRISALCDWSIPETSFISCLRHTNARHASARSRGARSRDALPRGARSRDALCRGALSCGARVPDHLRFFITRPNELNFVGGSLDCRMRVQQTTNLRVVCATTVKKNIIEKSRLSNVRVVVCVLQIVSIRSE